VIAYREIHWAEEIAEALGSAPKRDLVIHMLGIVEAGCSNPAAEFLDHAVDPARSRRPGRLSYTHTG
jgi:hypothetical protein